MEKDKLASLFPNALVKEFRIIGMKKILLFFVGFYRHHLSPLKGTACCRFIPTCSQYAMEAIEKYGALKGGALAVWRILRCNPFCRGGYDPVP